MTKRFIGLLLLVCGTAALLIGGFGRRDVFAVRALSAGLGNQMFFLAAQTSYARHFHKEICLIEKSDVNDAFDLPFRFCTPAEVQKAEQKQCAFYRFDPAFFKQSDCSMMLHAYLQDERFFADKADLIKKMFRFSRPLAPELTPLKNEIITGNSVAVHIRRGDYLEKPHLYPILPLSYYEAGADYIRKKTHSPVHLYIFSDDTDWVEKNFKSKHPFTIVRGNSGVTDLHLMTLCHHDIIANSTFSWWGAYLNKNPDKIVIAPDVWNLEDTWWGDEVILKDWIVLPAH